MARGGNPTADKRQRAALRRANKAPDPARPKSQPSESQILAFWEKNSKHKTPVNEIEKQKKILRTKYASWLTRRESDSLWVSSDKYPAWERKFIDTVDAMRLAGKHSAKQLEERFSKMNFRTLGGLKLDARLIYLLRDKFRCEGKMHRPRQYKKKLISPVEPKKRRFTNLNTSTGP